MKLHFSTLLIVLIVGYIGGFSSQFFQPDKPPKSPIENYSASENDNPFQTQDNTDDINFKLEELQKRISLLENRLSEFTTQQSDKSDQNQTDLSKTASNSTRKNRIISPNKKNLTTVGVNPDMADDILRRIGQQQYRRLELQNLMRRADSTSRRQYARELRELNKNKISLRAELGEDTYDQYLFSSGQNNRVKITSVMTGSPAESAGFQSDDIILYYDNKKILSWSDIRKSTIQGEIGSYTDVEILRDGSQISIMVPRGTLGVELEATQLDPAQ